MLHEGKWLNSNATAKLTLYENLVFDLIFILHNTYYIVHFNVVHWRLLVSELKYNNQSIVQCDKILVTTNHKSQISLKIKLIDSFNQSFLYYLFLFSIIFYIYSIYRYRYMFVYKRFYKFYKLYAASFSF